MMGSLPADKWEREVYQQLKSQLPPDWVAISSVGWSRQGPSDEWRYVRDGQADFVVLAPGLGMVVVEVKGSRGFRVAGDGRWFRINATGKEAQVDEPPPAQATRNMHELEDVVLKKMGWQAFPGLYAYVVVYPQGRLVGAPPATYDSTTMIVASQLHELTPRLCQALLARGHGRRGESFTPAVVQQVAQLLTSQSLRIVKADTATDVQDDLAKVDELTRQQFAALQGIFAHPRVAVTGPAGSGKTVLALWRLAALIASGQRALYVCYNKALAEALQRRDPALGEHIRNVDSYFRGIVAAAGKLPPHAVIQQDVTGFFRERLPELFMDVVVDWTEDERYDAIIVDEGQDFSDLQLIALLEMLKPDVGSYVFFADWRQDVFGKTASGAVGADVVFTLHHNCRNTVRINTRTNRLSGTQVPSMPGVPEGSDPVVACSTTPAAMASQAWKLAHEWKAGGGQVAILSPWTLENSSMNGARRGHGLRLVTSLAEWNDGDAVYFSTIKSFKGIEAASVIVVDLDIPQQGTAFQPEDLYVACTRATTRLALLAKNKAAAAWMEGQLRSRLE